MNQPIDVFDTRYFRINKLLLSLLGLWPMQSSFNKSTLFYCGVLGTLILILPQVAYLFKHVRSLIDFFDVLPVFIGSCICLLKIIGLHWHIEKFRMLVQHIRHDWCLSAKCNDIWILIKYAERNRIFTLVYIISSSTAVACLATAPLTLPLLDIILASNVTRSRQMPQQAEFFLDIEKYYYILLAITLVGYVTCSIIANATDTIYFALMQHTCGTMATLSYRLEKIAVRDKSKSQFHCNPKSKGDRDIEDIVQCIQLQVRIEKLVHLIESTFATSLFIDVGLGILLQCSACVMIVIGTEMTRTGPLVLIQAARFFFNSWIGQKIINYSSQISIAAYNGLWYQTSLKARKILLFLITKCQKPCQITLAKLYVVCFETYSTLMRMSASYITLMISLNLDDM